MSVEMIAEHINPLLGRKDAKLIIHHEGTGTPDRLAVRKIASDHFKTQQDKVYVRSVRTRTGGSSAICEVEVYGDSKLAEKIVPAYVKNRNLTLGQRVSRKKGEEEKAAPAASKPPAPEKKAEPPKPAPAKESKPAPAETKPSTKPEAKTSTKPEAKAPAKPPAKQDSKAKA